MATTFVHLHLENESIAFLQRNVRILCENTHELNQLKNDFFFFIMQTNLNPVCKGLKMNRHNIKMTKKTKPNGFGINVLDINLILSHVLFSNIEGEGLMSCHQGNV